MRAFPLKAALAALLVATPLGAAYAGGGGHGHDRGDHSRSADNGKGDHGNKGAHNNHDRNNHERNNRHSARFERDKAIVERNLAIGNGGSVAFNLANGSLHTADIIAAFNAGEFGPIHRFDHNRRGENDGMKKRHGMNSHVMNDDSDNNGRDHKNKNGNKHAMNDDMRDHNGKNHHKKHEKEQKRFRERFIIRFQPPGEADNSYYTNEMNMGPAPAYSLHPPHCIRDPNGACIVTPGGYYLSVPPAFRQAPAGAYGLGSYTGYGPTTLLTGRSRRVAGATTPYGAGTP